MRRLSAFWRVRTRRERAEIIGRSVAILVISIVMMTMVRTWSSFIGRPTKTTVTRTPGGERTTVEVVGESEPERVLGQGGLILLRVGVIALVGIFAGGVAKGIYLGRFSLKFGSVQMDDPTVDSVEMLEDIVATSTRHEELIKRASTTLKKNVTNVRGLQGEWIVWSKILASWD